MQRMPSALQKLSTRFRFHTEFQRSNGVRRHGNISVSTSSEPVSVPGTVIRLREYQEECIQSVLSYLQKGHRRLGV